MKIAPLDVAKVSHQSAEEGYVIGIGEENGHRRVDAEDANLWAKEKEELKGDEKKKKKIGGLVEDTVEDTWPINARCLTSQNL